MKNASTNLDSLRTAIDSDLRRLCVALGLRPDGKRFYCPLCQNDGLPHADGDFSTEAGFKCHRCGWTGDGLALVRAVRHCDFAAAVEFARSLYGVTAGTEPNTHDRKPGGGKIHPSLDAAAKVALWSVEKQTGAKHVQTRCDIYEDPDGPDLIEWRFDRVGELDENGKPVKTFRTGHKVPDGFKLNDPPGELPLLNKPELLKQSGTVIFCEGPKTCEAGASVGLLCTTTAHGAGAADKSDFSPLAGRDVVVLPDNDPVNPATGKRPGLEYAETGARLASEAGAASVHVVMLPGLPAKGDLFDFIETRTAEGKTPAAIRAEIEAAIAAAEVWRPTAQAKAKQETPAATVEKIRSALWAIMQEKLSATELHRKISGAVVAWLHKRGRFYFHEDRRDFSGVMFFDCERKLLLPVQSDAFLAWLADSLSMNRAERAFAFIAAACETEGLSERAQGIRPAAYWAARPGAFYLSNRTEKMARITAEGVELVDNGTDGVLFPCGATLEPWTLTEPADPFETCAIFRDLSTAAPHGKRLLQLWLCTLPADLPCKPPLCIYSLIGGGKTATVRGMFKLFGLPEQVNAVLKNGESDFWAALDGGGLACFDNVDTRVDWLPDALAAAATGGCYTKRRLYTDAALVTLRARAAVVVTSASPSFAADPGLADRQIVVRLERRRGETAERELFEEITRHRNAGLSWLCQTLSKALADKSPVPGGLNARHPDFAALAVRIGRAMDCEAEAVAAVQAAEADKGLFNLENDTVGAALLEIVQTGPFYGTANELLAKLIEAEPGFEGRLSDKRLGKRLAKMWPHLESVLQAEKERDGHSRTWNYSFKPIAGFAGFGELFSEKSPRKENIESFAKTPLETPQTPQNGFAEETGHPSLFDEERAAIQEFDGGLDPETAETSASMEEGII